MQNKKRSVSKTSIFIFLSIAVLVLFVSTVSAERLPMVNGDSNNWGTILNNYLIKIAGVNATELNGTMVNGTNIYPSSINTTQILNGTIVGADISNTTNLTLGEKLTFTLGGVIDNIIDGWITITGGLNVTNGLEVNGSTTFSGGNFSVNNSDLFVNINNGRVGIGTNTPSDELNIIGNLNATGNLTLANKITFAFGEIIDNIVDGWITITGGLNVTNGLEVNGSTVFNEGNISVTGGRIGIGTTTPSDPLTLNVSVNDEGFVLMGASVGISPVIKIANASGNIFARIGIAGGAGELVSNSSQGDLVIRAEQNNISFTTNGGGFSSVVIDTSGNTQIKGDIYTTAWSDYAGTSTIGGFVTPTANIWYKRVGKLVFVNFYIYGTSNSNVLSFTLPFTSVNSVNAKVMAFGQAEDSGSPLAIPASVQLAPNSNIVNIYKDSSGAVWTTTGTKSSTGQFFYEAQ